VTAFIERLDDDPRPPVKGDASADPRQLLSAVALARGLMDLAGSYGARRAASDVWGAALRATAAGERVDWARAGHCRCRRASAVRREHPLVAIRSYLLP
jgi:hypothetical protein